MTSALPIDMVSDVVCPWCFIGKRRLEKAIGLLPDVPVTVRFRPYFLNPWVPRAGISREEYLTTKFGSPERYRAIAQRVAQAATAEGLTYAFDGTDPEVLIQAAGQCGLNSDLVRRRLATDDDEERVERDANSAKDAGIDGVPCFIFGDRVAVQGAQAPEHVAQAIQRAANDYAKGEAAE
jgi:predicted DsbA family dithiol-disulfide isomerase